MADTATKKRETVGDKFARVVGGSTAFAGVDQGIDFTGAGPVYAIGEGKVTRYEPSGSGWPGEGAVLNYTLTAGPQAGKSVYVAEDFKAAAGIAQGSVVHTGQVIGYATGSGLAPGIEIGWAQPSGVPLAPRPAPRPAPQWTPEGQNFLGFVLTGIPQSSSPPSTPSDGGGSFFGNAAGAVGGAIDYGLTHGAIDLPGADKVPGVSAVKDVRDTIDAVPKAIKWIFDWHNLQRVLEVVAGGALIGIGVVMVGRAASRETPVQQTTGATRTVTRTVVRRSPKTPARARPQAPRRAARPKMRSYTLPADQRPRRPRRGEPGSTKLARGDSIPF